MTRPAPSARSAWIGKPPSSLDTTRLASTPLPACLATPLPAALGDVNVAAPVHKGRVLEAPVHASSPLFLEVDARLSLPVLPSCCCACQIEPAKRIKMGCAQSDPDIPRETTASRDGADSSVRTRAVRFSDRESVSASGRSMSLATMEETRRPFDAPYAPRERLLRRGTASVAPIPLPSCFATPCTARDTTLGK